MTKPYFDMFLNDVGHAWQVLEGSCEGSFEAHTLLCAEGSVRAGVLAALADVVAGGLANVTMAPRIPLTVDLSLHRYGPVSGTVAMTARNVKVGRSTTVGEVVFSVNDAPVAIAHVTFMPSPRPEDVMEEVHWGRPPSPVRMTKPIFEQIGARLIGPGVVELDLERYVMQPSGTIQGGAVALIGEMAATSLSGRTVTDLEIRYLSAVRVGPARTEASNLGDGLVRVAIRDTGNNDRLTTLVMARVAPVAS
jgi:acyl-coenzyme A thioesterase PaaI-like protein